MKKSQRPQKLSFWQGVKTPVKIAHRGGDGAGIEKENSLEAFQAAYELGYRWFETDVVTTKDGKLLAIHGRGFQLRPNRDLPRRLAIQQMTYAEAQKKITVGGEPVLLLEELLDAFKDVRVFIDPKTYKTAPVLAELLIARPGDLQRVCIGSFHRRNTTLVQKRVKEATGQEITCGAIGVFRGLLLVWTARLSLPSFWVRRYLRQTGTNTFYLPYSVVMKGYGNRVVALAHDLGLRVTVYTPNDENSIRECLARGVDGIMSDRVRLLKELMLSK